LEEEKAAKYRARSGLAAKIEFYYGAGQTVNFLALRLQWFESTPTQASPRAILEVFKPFGGQLGISFPVSEPTHSQPLKTNKRGKILTLYLTRTDTCSLSKLYQAPADKHLQSCNANETFSLSGMGQIRFEATGAPPL
jgi:hypothetical protein